MFKIRYAKIEKNSVANGPGIRVVLWCQGCTLHCPGCHNQSTWSFSDGSIFDDSALEEIYTELNKDYVDGITFSGGHPLEPENFIDCLYIALNIKQKYPTKTIWLYTGLTLNYKHFSRYHSFGCRGQNKMLSHLLNLCDVVVDGPYIESERDLTLKFRGSRNQRLIDVKETLKQGKIITLE